MSVFLLARTFERGNLHSTGMSRFIATPAPVPLRDGRLNSSSHVACSYSGARPKDLPASQGCSMFVAGSMLSETPGGLDSALLSRAIPHGLLVRSKRSAVHPNFPVLGATCQIQGTPFTSPTPATSSSTGRLDRPYPERLSNSWIGHLFSFSIMAQSLVN